MCLYNVIILCQVTRQEYFCFAHNIMLDNNATSLSSSKVLHCLVNYGFYFNACWRGDKCSFKIWAENYAKIHTGTRVIFFLQLKVSDKCKKKIIRKSENRKYQFVFFSFQNEGNFWCDFVVCAICVDLFILFSTFSLFSTYRW